MAWGRTLQQKEEAEPDPESGLPRVAVDSACFLTARGKIKAAFPPFLFQSGGGYA